MRLVIAILLCWAGLVATAGAAAPTYWLGSSFEGLPLVHEDGGDFSYGDCDAGPDGGCYPPLQVQNRSACLRNPLRIDVLARIRSAGGRLVVEYGGRLELIAGGTNVALFGEDAQLRRAMLALRERNTGARLRAPRYPPMFLAELRFTRDAARRNPDLAVLRRRLRVSKSEIRFRLALARRIDLRAAPRTTRTPGYLQRQRRLATGAQLGGLRSAARGMGLSLHTARRMLARERGDLQRCRRALD